MDYAKALGGAFVAGGLFGILGQLLAMAAWSVPALSGNETIAVLFTMGVIGGILFATGAWDKIEKAGGMGANLAFSGLAAAAAGIVFGVSMETGSYAKGILTMLKEIVLKVLLVATAICVVIVAIVFFADGATTDLGAQAMAFSAATGGQAPPVVPAYVGANPDAVGGLIGGVITTHDPALGAINIAWAFLVCGAIGLVCQLIVMVGKIPVPVFLTGIIVVGAIMTVAGVINPFLDAAGGGFQILTLDAGQAIAQLFAFALAGGLPGVVPFLSLIGVFVLVAIIGAISGVARASSMRKKMAQQG